MKHKVQVTYRSGRNITVECEEFETVDDMMEAMIKTHWFLHSGGAENMLEVERIKPLSGAGNVAAFVANPTKVR